MAEPFSPLPDYTKPIPVGRPGPQDSPFPRPRPAPNK